MPFTVDISYADGTTVSHVVTGEQATIGSGTEAAVRVHNAAEIASEQLLLIERSNGCWITSARDAPVQPLRRGKRFENGLVPWGTELDVGSIVVRVRRSVDAAPAPSRRWSVMLIAAAAAGTLAVWLDGGEAGGLPTTSAAPPALFDGRAAACPDVARAATAALEAYREAEAREGRYPYDPQDGVVAVRRSREAAACAELAGEGAIAAAADELASRMELRIETDYKARRLDLDRARRARDLPRIGRVARALRRLVAHRPGAYRDWLLSVERYVSTRLEPAPRR